MDEGPQRELERATQGPITVDITTIGRTSGRPRRIEVWMVDVDGSYVIGGTPGPRDWYANILVNPHVTIHFKTLAEVDVAAIAVPVTDPDHRRRIYEHPATAWYRTQVPVDELVASGPTVFLEFRSSAPGRGGVSGCSDQRR